MNATTTIPLSYRDRAVLRAVAAGRCEISETFGGNLVSAGGGATDLCAAPRRPVPGLNRAGPFGGRPRLTGSGRALLEAA